MSVSAVVVSHGHAAELELVARQEADQKESDKQVKVAELAVETMPSLAPSTAALSQPMRSTR